jgi:hypothetical protein
MVGSAVLQSAPVTVTCAAPLISSVTSGSNLDASCASLTNGYSDVAGAARATANVALQIAANGADFSSLSTYQSAFARQAPPQSSDDLFGPAAQSSVAINYTSTLYTGGSNRSGYLKVQAYGYGANFYDGGATMASGIVSASGSPYQTEVTCYSNSAYCTPGTAYYTYNDLIPVTLGTAFILEANGATTNWSAAFDAFSGGYLRTVYDFRFLEADGVTPVPVSEAPEPLAVAMTGLGIGALGLLLKKKRSRG